MKRFLEKGEQKLSKELDLLHLVTLLKKLEKLVHDPLAVDNSLVINIDEDEQKPTTSQVEI